MPRPSAGVTFTLTFLLLVVQYAPLDAQDALDDVELTECGASIGCYRVPEGCATREECDHLLIWQYRPETDSVRFDISADSDGYVAMGLSNARSMRDSSVAACMREEGEGVPVMVMNSYNNNNRVNMPLPQNEAMLGVSNVVSDHTDGRLHCQFSRAVTVEDSTRIYDLDQPYHLLFAVGAVVNNRIQKHPVTPMTTPSKINFQEAASVSGSIDNKMLKIHATLMVIAWMVCAGTAIILARYYRSMWPGVKLFDKDVWFTLHVTLQVTNVLLNIAAFVIIFVHIDGLSEYKAGRPRLSRAHPILGICIFCLTMIQPVMGYFRPHPGTANRPMFNWAHWGVGTLAHIGAIFNIFLGIGRSSASTFTEDWLKYVILAYAIVHVLWQLLLEMAKRSRTQAQEKSSKSNDGSTIMTLLLLTYVAFVIAAAVVTIITFFD